MKKLAVATCLLAAAMILLDACDDIAKNFGYIPARNVKQFPKRERPTPTHRFILTRSGAEVALDTQTGQLCRTWDWQPAGKTKSYPESEVNPQRILGEYAPACLSIYQQYPTVAGPDDRLVIPDEQPN
jgi:hypothetical protein